MAVKKSNYEHYKELVLSEIPKEPCQKHHKNIAYNLNMRPVDVREIIRMLRDDGYAICSNPVDGYWMARNKSEVQQVIDMFYSYINSMQGTIDSLKKTRRRFDNEY